MIDPVWRGVLVFAAIYLMPWHVRRAPEAITAAVATFLIVLAAVGRAPW